MFRVDHRGFLCKGDEILSEILTPSEDEEDGAPSPPPLSFSRKVCVGQRVSEYAEEKVENEDHDDSVSGLEFACVEIEIDLASSLLFVFSRRAPICLVFEVRNSTLTAIKSCQCQCDMLPIRLEGIKRVSSGPGSGSGREREREREEESSVSLSLSLSLSSSTSVVEVEARYSPTEKRLYIVDEALLSGSGTGIAAGEGGDHLSSFSDSLFGVSKWRSWKIPADEEGGGGGGEYVAVTYNARVPPFVDVFFSSYGYRYCGGEGERSRFLFRVPLTDYRAKERLFEFFEHRGRVYLFVNNIHSNFTFYACPSGDPVHSVFPFDFFVTKYFRARDWLALYGWMWGPMEEMFVMDMPGLLSQREVEDDCTKEGKRKKKHDPYEYILRSEVTEDDGYVGWRTDIREGDGYERICRVGVDLDVDVRALSALSMGGGVRSVMATLPDYERNLRS